MQKTPAGWAIRVPLLVFLLACGSQLCAQDTLPTRFSDPDFWQLINTLSEPNGNFQSENLLSNETDFPRIMAEVKQTVKPDGVYLGVGPEQNFNYIAAVHPKIAFIIDIRRQNMIEHLLYKAIFELSPNRAAFISRLFSRKQPDRLAANLTAAELFDAYSEIPADEAAFKKNLAEIERLLIETHRFGLTEEDRESVRSIYAAFHKFGPLIDYSSQGGGPSGRVFRPSYAQLMTETDNDGREWSYLASEANYGVVRDLEARNLLIPITGDFGGPKAIRAVGRYVADHGAVVSAFYTSNVEGYLFQGGDRIGNSNGGSSRFYENAATLPLDGNSTFIRWIPTGAYVGGDGSSILLEPIQTTIDNFRSGRMTAMDFFRRGRIFGFANTPPRGTPPGGLYGYRTAPLIFDWSVYAWIAFHLLAAAVAFVVRYAGLLGSWRRPTYLSLVNTFSSPTTTPEDQRFARRARILSSFAAAIAGYAIAALIESALGSAGWLKLPVHLNRGSLIFAGTLIAANTAVLLTAAAFFLLKQSPGSIHWRRFTLGIIAPLILLPVFGIQAASDINRGLDLRPPIIIRTPVLERSEKLFKGSRETATTYYIQIDPTATAGILPEQIEVPRRIYDSVIEGDTIPIVVGRGTLGVPWYRSINGFSMND